MSSEGSTFGNTKFNPVKSQMWYNDGLWWGVFSDNDTGLYFYNFPNGAATRGPIIDGNINGIPDALWDGTNLYVAVWKSLALATLYKYSYNPGTKTHTLISGFPVPLTLFGSSSAAIVLEKDSTGKLWATYTGTQGGFSDGKIRVIWSTSADHKTWNTTGVELATSPRLAFPDLEISAITHFGGNKIGVAWSNQPDKEIAFRYHVDGQPETDWSGKEVIDSGNGPLGLGGVADDHLALKATPDGRLFLVAKDNDNDGIGANASIGRLWLYSRSAAGVWGQKTHIIQDPSQLPTRPVLLLDSGNNRAYVVYSDASPSGAQRTFITHTSMSSPDPFTSPCVFTSVASSNPTSTKQNVSSATGIMAAASTGGFGGGDVIFRTVTLTPQATISSLSPSSRAVGGPAFTLTVTGNHFVNGSFVQWNNGPDGFQDLTTTFDSSTQLRANISASDISVAGTFPVRVYNPNTGEVTNEVPFNVNNPVPTLSSISSTNKTAGDPAFTLTVNGTNFLTSSVVLFNGSNRATTFASPTQLTAQIAAADLQTAGIFPITVFNPLPGGGTSGAINLTVTSPPAPTLGSISPTIKLAGEPLFTLTANGTNFVNGSVVRFNGSNRTTTFLSALQLTAQITAADIQAAGTFPITVFNPAGGTSSAINLTVNNPLPTLSSISPTSKVAGEAAFTLTVNGASFVNGSLVNFNGSSRATTFVSNTQLTAQITAADIQTAGTGTVTVFNPGPGGGSSTGASLTITAPIPVPGITGLSPSTGTAGGAAFTLTVNGNSFINGSIVKWNNAARTTTFVSSTQLSAQISAADIQTQGIAGITVFNPAPGGGTSNSANFTINPSPQGQGYESDVAPRPNGHNTGAIGISDWTQAGRFASGLDTVHPESVSNEFQRLDSAPKSTLGNGAITISDWTQAGRYAAGLDPVSPAGGPTSPPSLAPVSQAEYATRSAEVSAAETDRIVRVVDATLQGGPSGTVGPNGTVSVELESQGNENALGFSLTFDPAVLTYVSAAPGTAAISAGAQVNVNANSAAIGRVGFAIGLGGGSSFSVGTRQLVVVTFAVAANGNGSTTINFGDVPIGREIANPEAAELLAVYTSGTVVITPAPNEAPVLASISPDLGIVGGPGFTLTVNGSKFVNGSVVRWNGADRTTSFVSSTQLTALISTGDIQTSGPKPVDVVNPAPGGGISNPSNFAVHNPAPTISTLSPTSVIAQGSFFTLTVAGSNFVNGSVVKWNGADRLTTFVSSSQLTAEITAETTETAAVTVVNPAPGGGSSNSIAFTVDNPTPSVSPTFSPSSATAGGAAFQLGVNGSNFVAGSVVKWNGSDRPTSRLSSTQLSAQISAADIQTAGTATVAVFNPTPGGGTSGAIPFAINSPPPQLLFSAADFSSGEGNNNAQITVTRSGDTSVASSVDYLISDSTVADCDVVSGVAAQNCDYTITAGTLQFAAGETSKTFIVPIIDDAYAEGSETLTLQLGNPTVGASLGTLSTATLTILDNDSTEPISNPIDQAQFFVRQQYLDFLNREPDSGGLSHWTGLITQCGSDEACIRTQRKGVSAAFFIELEFQRTGSYAYRLYQGGLARHPSYQEFNTDRAQVVEGANLEATKQALALAFVQRTEFVQKYVGQTTAEPFVDALIASILQRSNVNLGDQRVALIGKYSTGADMNQSRALALRDAIDNATFISAEYNKAFVLMQYFAYLQRNPDPGGYNFWLGIVNNPSISNYQSMVCAFITSPEYQKRFSSVVTASDAQCGP